MSDKKCEFCENSKMIYERELAYGYKMRCRELILSNKRIISVKFESADELDTKFKEIGLEINFCPNCGRDLRS